MTPLAVSVLPLPSYPCIKSENLSKSNKAGLIKGQKNLWYHRSRFFRVRCRFLLCTSGFETTKILW